jgi:hypothetical protein
MTGYNEHGVRYVWLNGRKHTIIRDGSDRLMWSSTNLSHLHVERGHAR